MSELTLPRAIGRGLALLVLVSLLMPSLSNADDGLADELRLCSIVQDAELRLSCYDKISGGPLPSFRTALLGCSRNVNDEFFFYLANGQVWRYAFHKRLNLHDCNRQATISKVSGGHLLVLDGDKRRIRVIRVK